MEPDESFAQAKFVGQCMDECRKELKQTDIDVKAIAVSKLTYVCPINLLAYPRAHIVLQLQMLGYDVSWASSCRKARATPQK